MVNEIVNLHCECRVLTEIQVACLIPALQPDSRRLLVRVEYGSYLFEFCIFDVTEIMTSIPFAVLEGVSR